MSDKNNIKIVHKVHGTVAFGDAPALMNCDNCKAQWIKEGTADFNVKFTLKACPDCTDNPDIKGLRECFKKIPF